MIGIDARDLAPGGTGPGGTGIATYARGVLQAVAALGGEAELLVAAVPWASSPPRGVLQRRARAMLAGLVPLRTTLPDRGGGASDPDAPAARLRLAPDAFRLAQVQFDLWGRPLDCIGPDLPALMHWTSPLPLRLRGVPNIVTLHDAIPLRRPNRTGTDPVRYRRLLRAVTASAARVLTVSEASRRELEAELPELAGRIAVIPQAVRLPAGLPPGDPAGVVGRGRGEYYLYAGTIEPRKNVSALVAAFLASASPRRLVLAGPDGWQAAAELAPHRDRIGPAAGDAPVLRLGYVDRTTLLQLVAGARALLYPSLGEGFGLPIVEAMRLGTPVLTGRDGATGEVAGDAALLVDPADPAGIAAGIARLDRDDALCAALRDRGRARARLFAPELYAERLGRLYEDVLRRR